MIMCTNTECILAYFGYKKNDYILLQAPQGKRSKTWIRKAPPNNSTKNIANPY